MTDSHRSGDAAMPRRLGRFELLRLEGRSLRSMAWRVLDAQRPDGTREFYLVMSRTQPADSAAMQRWEQDVRRASRLEHPNLAAVLETGSIERWPYALYEARGSVTLQERLQGPALGNREACELLADVLRGLAYVHDARAAHRDLQPYLVVLGDLGEVRLMGLEVGALLADHAEQPTPARTSVEALALDAQRQAARRDLLCAGFLFHRLLSGQPPLGEADLGALTERIPPAGREWVRLPWDVGRPVPEALRAIANRSTDRQPALRYRSARGMARALDGWVQSESAAAGPLALLLDRLHSVGTLPASPGSAARAARLATMDRHRTHELAEVVLQDLALAFELLRTVNSANVRGALVAGSGAVLTVRRAIALLGLDGVRRAATGLRPWPGPLSDDGARELRALFDTARRAGRVAQALRPAGYDAEVVHLATLLQNLGRLVAGYHLPDELQQIRRLMRGTSGEESDTGGEPGMSEQSASYAVLGTDIEAIGTAVARQWGLGDTALHLIRRLPAATPPRAVDSDDDMVRAVCSCANEAVDTLALPVAQREAALRRVARRYGRALRIDLRDLREALNASSRGDGTLRATPSLAETGTNVAMPTQVNG
jgi:eukaryotic-like serine/threonine-protein kinase